MRLCYHCMTKITDEKAHTCPVCGKSLSVEPVDGKFLQPGTVLLGKFIIGYPLGAGGFGNTYVGWNQVLQTRVAIKEYFPEQYTSRGGDGVTITLGDHSLIPRFRKGLQQFLEEARSVAMLHTVEGVVEISDFFEANGTGYLVMEYLEGVDIKGILKKAGGKMDYEWSRKVVLTLLNTLREIHKRGVLHRDIAPDNVYITKEGVIKLIDFGAAKHASELANMKADVMLKVGYAPIEQYSRTAAQGPYTDLYEVAALFYRMLTGQKPIPANERLHEDGLIPPSDMGLHIPEQAEMAIMVCLNVRPEFRLQTADEFIEALDGQNFRPNYDDFGKVVGEAIVHPANSLAGRFGRLPVMAKAAICFLTLCLVGGAVAGGVALSQKRTTDAGISAESLPDGQARLGQYEGLQLEDVTQELERKGITNIAVEYQLDDADEGMILKQSVGAGEVVSVEDELAFTVSGGSKNYTMPECAGHSEKEIIQMFTNRNFNVTVYGDPYKLKENIKVKKANNPNEKRKGKVKIKYVFKKSKKGKFIDQSPAVGENVSSDQDVTITLSMGGTESDFKVALPSFVNSSKEEVEAKLKKLKLGKIVKVTYETGGWNSSIAEGKVSDQSLEQGTKINLIKDKKKGKNLVLYLSRGPEPVPEEPEPKKNDTDTYRRRRNSNQNNHTNSNSNSNGKSDSNRNSNRNSNSRKNSTLEREHSKREMHNMAHGDDIWK